MDNPKTLKTKRISLTIPSRILENIDKTVSIMGLSRSALISHLLDEPTAQMAEILEQLMGDVSPDVSARRSTIHTQQILQTEIAKLQTGFAQLSMDLWSKDDTNGH